MDTENLEISREVKLENDKVKSSNWQLPASILFAGILIAGAVIYSNGAKSLNPSNQEAQINQQAGNVAASLKLNENDVVLGDIKAPVTIVEFGDFQCPFCSKFFKETEPQIRKNFIETGKAKMVFKPIAILGDESTNAALATYCAKDQGKFWEFHDAIYGIEYDELQKYMAGKGPSSENNGNLNRDLLRSIASGLKMDTDSFLNCYDSKKYEKVLTNNGQDASVAMDGRISTPTLFISGQMIQGALPYETFATAINSFLK